MKLLIASYGTEGDVRPLAALALRWIEAGHDALLLADQATLGVPREFGVPCSPLSGDILGLAGDGAGIAGVLRHAQGGRGMTNALARIANEQAVNWLREIIAAGRDADAILASGLAIYGGLSAGEYLGIPVVGASFIPLTPTREFASPFLPPANWPGLLNRASHHVVNTMIWRSMRDATNAARRSVARLPPRRKPWTTHPVLYGISPTLLPRPRDWPAQVRLCGQWLRPVRTWLPPPGLASFLAAGSPPIHIGFGSMTGFDRPAIWREVLAALGGRRAIVTPGWAGVEGVDLPDNVFVLDQAPHDALFPHVSAVVHHGGSGTSHSATRAGRPSVVVSFAGDQAFWGGRLCALGLAAPPLPARRLTGAALARALEFTARPRVRDRAQELGERMRAEDGTGMALQALQRLWAGRPDLAA